MKRDLAYLWISVGFAACGAAVTVHEARYGVAVFLALIAVVNTAIAVRQGGWK